VSSNDSRKRRRERITGWILGVSAIIAAVIAWEGYSAASKAGRTASSAAGNVHGAAGAAVAGFAGFWVLFAVAGFVAWGIVAVLRRKPEPEAAPVRRGRRHGADYRR
jgi:hypothetical protein